MTSRVLFFATAVMLALLVTLPPAPAARLGDAAGASRAGFAEAIDFRPGERCGNIRRHWGVPLATTPLLQPDPYDNLRPRGQRCSYVWDPRIYRHVLSCW